MTNNAVAVRTVGLSPERQAELAVRLARYPEIELQHLAGWNFSLLHASVIVLGADNSAGQETLDMLREFAGVRPPELVTFSENDERMRAVVGDKDRAPFTDRLQQALRKAGCGDVVVAPFEVAATVNAPQVAHVEGPVARAGIRWAD